MYTKDHDEFYPCAWDNAGGNNQGGGWMFYKNFPNQANGDFDPAKGSLYNYTKNTAIYRCPSDSSEQGNSYAVNALILFDVGSVGTCHAGRGLSAFSATANTFLFVEENSNSNNSTDDGYLLPPGNKPSVRHFGGSTFVFCDGHTKWLALSAVTYPNPGGAYRYEP